MAAFLSLLVALVAPSLDAAPPVADPGVTGTWTASEYKGDLLVTLVWGGDPFRRTVPPDELDGLVPSALGAVGPTPVAFRLERAAGRIEFGGAFEGGAGAGEFEFVGDRGFAEALAELGVAGGREVSDDGLLELALAGTTPASARSLVAADVGPLGVAELVRLSVLGVDGAYIRSMRAVGVPVGSWDEAVELHVQGVTPDYVEALAGEGYAALSPRRLSEMRAQGVTAAFVRGLREVGYDGLTPRQLITAAVLGVDPAFVRGVRERGAEALSIEDLIRLRARADG